MWCQIGKFSTLALLDALHMFVALAARVSQTGKHAASRHAYNSSNASYSFTLKHECTSQLWLDEGPNAMIPLMDCTNSRQVIIAGLILQLHSSPHEGPNGGSGSFPARCTLYEQSISPW
jgi:hypothetical protein